MPLFFSFFSTNTQQSWSRPLCSSVIVDLLWSRFSFFPPPSSHILHGNGVISSYYIAWWLLCSCWHNDTFIDLLCVGGGSLSLSLQYTKPSCLAGWLLALVCCEFHWLAGRSLFSLILSQCEVLLSDDALYCFTSSARCVCTCVCLFTCGRSSSAGSWSSWVSPSLIICISKLLLKVGVGDYHSDR